ncbi:MAG TPA: gamma-glutamyl-gamma-aminobutyrate hydrolase family protein [Chthoniobacteraceae bacterium]|jgi:putative glutamine amidotransferase
MPHLATWIRDSDEVAFGQFFATHPEIIVHNARVEEFDLAFADGLLVSGGPDVAAAFHPEPLADPSLIRNPEPARDAWEFAAVHSAYARGLPVLCICKGVQVLNLALGGTLHLHIDGHEMPELKQQNLQPVRYSTAARHRFPLVNSSHHQALDRVAGELEVEGWSVSDDVIEQVRLRNYPFGFGVQYHPERDCLYAPLFEDFFAHCKQ